MEGPTSVDCSSEGIIVGLTHVLTLEQVLLYVSMASTLSIALIDIH